MQLLMVCLLAVIVSSISLSCLYQAHVAYTLSVLCVKKEKMSVLAESALVCGLYMYQRLSAQDRQSLRVQKNKTITQRLSCLLEGKPVQITITYKVSGSDISIDGSVVWDGLRESVARVYPFIQAVM